MHEELRRTGLQDRVSDVPEILQVEWESEVSRDWRTAVGDAQKAVSIELGASKSEGREA